MTDRLPRPSELDLEFIREARAAQALHDVTFLFEKGRPDNEYVGVERIKQRLYERRCGLFMCGDKNHLHDKLEHFKQWVADEPHLLADNGGGILLDPKIRVIPGFRQSYYWRERIIEAVQLKQLDDFYIEGHSVCGQAEALGLSAPQVCLALCTGKAQLKREVRKIQKKRRSGRAFKVGILYHFCDGHRRRWYYVERQRLEPIAMRYVLGQDRPQPTRSQLAETGGGW